MPEKQLSETEIGKIHGEKNKNSENDCKDSKTQKKNGDRLRRNNKYLTMS